MMSELSHKFHHLLGQGQVKVGAEFSCLEWIT